MAEKNIKARIIIRKATSAEWSASTATPLKQGEFALNTTTGELKIATQDNQKFQDATALATKELVVGAVQYLGTVGTTTELNAKTPNSAGDFCRVSSTNFTLPSSSSITGAAVTTHAGDLLLCESISPSVKWSVIHGELDKNTWTPNSKTAAGYVAAGGSNANKVWKTDANGNPGWRDDANTIYTLPLAANGTRGGIQIGYSANGAHLPVQLSSEKAFITLTKNGINSAGFNEAYLEWGGKNFAGTYAPIDAALNPVLSPNRLAGFKPAGVLVEYTNDGTTWLTYNLTDAQKTSLFTTAQTIYIGGPKPNNVTNNSKVRVTIDGVDGGCYTSLNKMHIYISTSYSQNTKVTMESYDYNSSKSWHQIITDQPISGWSGWNILNFSLPGTGSFGGTNSDTHQRKIRLTFSHTHVTTGHEQNGLQISKIYAYGGVGWTTPSTLAAEGTPYTYNYAGAMKTMNDVYPESNKVHSLGYNDNQWKSIYGVTLYENGTALSSKYLGISAKAADSAKLGGTAASSYATQTWVTNQGYTKNIGTVTAVKINGTSKNPSNGVVDLGTVLTAHQAIKINGTAITPGTLNLKAGSNITFNNSNGTLTINASGGSSSDNPVLWAGNTSTYSANNIVKYMGAGGIVCDTQLSVETAYGTTTISTSDTELRFDAGNYVYFNNPVYFDYLASADVDDNQLLAINHHGDLQRYTGSLGGMTMDILWSGSSEGGMGMAPLTLTLSQNALNYAFLMILVRDFNMDYHTFIMKYNGQYEILSHRTAFSDGTYVCLRIKITGTNNTSFVWDVGQAACDMELYRIYGVK